MKIDPRYNRIQADTVWNCSFIRTGGYGLVGFSANISYATVLGQSGKTLVNNISSVSLNSIEFYPLLFSVEDEDTATSFVKSVIDKFVKSATVGSGFVQPSRRAADVSY